MESDLLYPHMEVPGRASYEEDYESGSGDNATEQATPLRRENWLFIRIPTVVYLLCSTYIAVVLTLEELHRKRRNCEAKIARWRIARLVAAYVTASACLLSCFSLVMEAYAVDTCDAALKFENAMYWMSLSAIYAAIWFRQRVIYENPAIRDITTKCTTVMGYTVGVLVVALPLMNVTLFYSTVTFRTDTNCEFASVLVPEAIFLFEVIVPLFLALTLLGLFVWPFVHGCCRAESGLLRGSIKAIIQRLIVTAAACAVTDLLFVGLTPWFLPIYVRYVGQQTSAFCNLVFLLLSFKNWKVLLHPRRHEMLRRRSQSSTLRVSNAVVTQQPAKSTEASILTSYNV